MAFRGEIEKAALVDRLAGIARDRAEKGKEATAERFIRAYFAHVPPADILCREEEALLAGALSILQLMQARDARTPLIRVFNPDPATDGWNTDI